MSLKIKGWIRVDLDGTLAHYDGWVAADEIGEPIPAMVRRVKKWIENGIEVKIFTARMSKDATKEEKELFQKALAKWCKQHLGKVLEATAEKDFNMLEAWDDRAVAVEHNTGKAKGWYIS